MQDLVDIDVADAGDHVLVEEQRLQLPATGEQQRPQPGPIEPVGDGIHPEPGQLRQLDLDPGGIEHHDLAERSGIDEPQLLRLGAVEVGDHMGVRRSGRALGRQQQLAAHAEMDHQCITGVERADEVLPPPAGRQHGRAGQPGNERLA